MLGICAVLPLLFPPLPFTVDAGLTGKGCFGGVGDDEAGRAAEIKRSKPDIFLVGFGGLLVERPGKSDTVAVVSVVGVDRDVEADEEALVPLSFPFRPPFMLPFASPTPPCSRLSSFDAEAFVFVCVLMFVAAIVVDYVKDADSGMIKMEWRWRFDRNYFCRC